MFTTIYLYNYLMFIQKLFDSIKYPPFVGAYSHDSFNISRSGSRQVSLCRLFVPPLLPLPASFLEESGISFLSQMLGAATEHPGPWETVSSVRIVR
jgi:hypothetical protein